MGAYRRSLCAWLIPAALLSLVLAAPAAAQVTEPTFTGTDPASPANENDPLVQGIADGGTTVFLYDDAACTDPALASGSAEDFGAAGIPVSVGDDTTTTFWAKADDGVDESSCSTDSIAYVEDSTPPDAPTITATDPASPADDATPLVQGSTGGGSPTAVRVYETADCTGGFTTGTVAAFTGAGIEVTVAEDATTPLSATTVDAVGNESACSNTIAYVEDSTAPAAPSVTDTDPNSPANDNAPEIKGAAETGSTVTLYASSNCTGGFVASGMAADFATPGFTVAVGNDSTTTFSATSTDAAGNVSDCSTTTITYVEDSTAPAAPTGLASEPDSPSNDETPAITGTAEAGSTVTLFGTDDCTGTPLGSGSAADFASPGITVTVPEDATTPITAKATDAAGNPSPCSAPLNYTEDSTAPALPTLDDTDPDSPANDNNPEIKGTAEAGSTVALYTTSDCSGGSAGTTTAEGFADPGETVTVADDSSTTFWAKATDSAGNASACSTDSITYVEDSTAPDAPAITDTDPDSPANDDTPLVKGTTGAGSPTAVRVYESADCTGGFTAGTVAAFTGSGIEVTVAEDASTPLSARTVDAAGNESTCSNSITYVEDSTAPDAPAITDTDPDSPANDDTPLVKGTTGAGSPTAVRVYESADCTGGFTAGTVAAFTGSGIEVTVTEDASTPLSARTVDAAGNESTCSNSITYVEESTPPAAPSITDSDPDSPANENNPEIKGTAAAGSTVNLYTTSDCTGTPVATGSAAQFATPGLTVNVADDSTTTLRATASNAAGPSACSAPFDYVEDSTPPAAPAVTGTTPTSPANNNSPKVKGTVGSGSPTTVRVYKSTDCSGPVAGTGTVAEFTGTGITISVADDTTNQLSARTVDAAGNESACSQPPEPPATPVVYVEDSTAPPSPTMTETSPPSPANDNSPEIKGTADPDAFTIRIYANSNCTGTPTTIGLRTQFVAPGPGITVSVADDTVTTFSAKARDRANNESPCSPTTITYTEQSTGGVASPTFSDTDPDSPANDNAPEIKGTAPAGSAVILYTTPDCTGSPAATGSAAEFADPGITVAVPNDSSTTFYATATDASSTVSPCSNGPNGSITYVEDSTAPALPTLDDTDPDSPANDNNPEVKGTAESGSTVNLYTT
ncbi:MAG: Ig-like domain-containing protein, partial [Actinomycetota bacterium]|nr:Ig-like domain-containing protein [Actinomycetota bacterium]